MSERNGNPDRTVRDNKHDAHDKEWWQAEEKRLQALFAEIERRISNPTPEEIAKQQERENCRKESRKNAMKEAKLFRQLVNRIIDSGYKVQASKLHPDKGGTDEEMARLNKARDILRKGIKGII